MNNKEKELDQKMEAFLFRKNDFDIEKEVLLAIEAEEKEDYFWQNIENGLDGIWGKLALGSLGLGVGLFNIYQIAFGHMIPLLLAY